MSDLLPTEVLEEYYDTMLKDGYRGSVQKLRNHIDAQAAVIEKQGELLQQAADYIYWSLVGTPWETQRGLEMLEDENFEEVTEVYKRARFLASAIEHVEEGK